jgi:hypothetical protein
MRSHLRLVVSMEEPRKGDIPNNLPRAQAPAISARARADRTSYILIFFVLLITSLWVSFLAWALIQLLSS